MSWFLAATGWIVAVLVIVMSARSRGRTTKVAAPTMESNVEPGSDVADLADLTDVLDALTLGVVVVGSDGSEIVRNRSASELTGTLHADVLLNASAYKLLEAALGGTSGEERVHLTGPPERMIIVRALPVGDGRAIATFEDDTERWRIDRVRTDFVANVSHELKTPIGAISVLAETLEGETDDELILRIVGRMILESERMSRTVDELLELSRIELGGEMIGVNVGVADVAREAIERVAPIAERRGVPVRMVDGADGAEVWGDQFQLMSATGNLIENAVKYSDPGAEVVVTTRAVDGNVEIEVRDHGIGIPAASLDRIFERFYRVDRARSRGTGGTGLGLSIVRHVAQNHGGEVNVTSREGEGSVFTLRLPRSGRP